MKYMGSYAIGMRGKRMSVYRVSGLICCLVALMVVLMPESAYAAVNDLGDVLRKTKYSIASFPRLLAGLGYLIGLFFVISGIFKFKDHTENPSQNPISSAVKRLVAGGGALSGTYLAGALKGSLGASGLVTTSARSSSISGTGMDVMVYNLVSNTYGPSVALLSACAYIAAIILLITGIIRLTKTSQEGPRGPAGLGTIITFLVSGALFSAGGMVNSFMKSLFGGTGPNFDIKSKSAITSGIISDPTRIQTVIDAVMAFVMIVGLIAFLRGLFVLRAFADGGSQNASVAQSLTFLFGGALAINLGEFINVLQESLGIGGTLTFG